MMTPRQRYNTEECSEIHISVLLTNTKFKSYTARAITCYHACSRMTITTKLMRDSAITSVYIFFRIPCMFSTSINRLFILSSDGEI